MNRREEKAALKKATLALRCQALVELDRLPKRQSNNKDWGFQAEWALRQYRKASE